MKGRSSCIQGKCSITKSHSSAKEADFTQAGRMRMRLGVRELKNHNLESDFPRRILADQPREAE